MRVVYDASCKADKHGVSLNDCLHVGLPLTPLLFEILLRFREKRIALAADIEKAFLNIEIAKTDRDVLRFLWVDDVNSDKIKPVVYRFCRVVFGVNCSPFLLNATLRCHLDSYAHNNPEFVKKLKDSFYVDDLISGEQSEEKTIELYRDAKQTLLTGGFRLRKWLTNSATVRKAIEMHESQDKGGIGEKTRQLEHEKSYAKCALEVHDETRSEKVLGLPWNCETDTFHFNLARVADRAKGLIPTKRNILSVLAAMYDPLGIVSPISVTIKVLFQEICVAGLDWDIEIHKMKEK